MLSDKEIVCPNNILDVAHKKNKKHFLLNF